MSERSLVSQKLADVLKASTLSRYHIAVEMTALLDESVTETMLNKYCAASREDYKWPAQYDIALCTVLNDWSLLSDRVERAGFRMITEEEAKLLELGKAYAALKAAEKGARL